MWYSFTKHWIKRYAQSLIVLKIWKKPAYTIWYWSCVYLQNFMCCIFSTSKGDFMQVCFRVVNRCLRCLHVWHVNDYGPHLYIFIQAPTEYAKVFGKVVVDCQSVDSHLCAQSQGRFFSTRAINFPTKYEFDDMSMADEKKPQRNMVLSINIKSRHQKYTLMECWIFLFAQK